MGGILTGRLGKKTVEINFDSAKLNDQNKLIISVKHTEKNGKGNGYFPVDADSLKNHPGFKPIKEALEILRREKEARKLKCTKQAPVKVKKNRGLTVNCHKPRPALTH
ncbi:MAG: hypothetical protein NTX66_00935 [Candidatus Falkowbacteria bacterium]|nr:hypothetical protein [Candidatus Falkowbacteria bacterium]